MAEEQQYPYTPVPKRMESLLAKIPTIGRPSKATQAWLKGLGYTSSNDRQTLAALRRLGVIGGSGEPTEFYDAFRNKDGGKIAESIRQAYRELFEIYPDAQQKDDEALQNFFRSKTTAGESVQRLMVRTFQTVCSFGSFDDVPPLATVTPPDGSATGSKERKSSRTHREPAAGHLTLNVNIQLQLPPSAEGDVYEKLFEAMGKHLKGLASFG